MKRITGYINNLDEAILFVHAIRLGLLKPTENRLKPEERDKIESGDIFCFIKTDTLKRWTDRKIWSPSKISGEFLIYQEVPRFLSKNSIKKRKISNLNTQYIDKTNFYNAQNLNVFKIPDKKDYPVIDKTTLHKKTVCIQHDGLVYHLVSYYRPIFVNSSLMDTKFFQDLRNALDSYPDLLKDSFLKENVLNDDFYSKYKITKKFEFSFLNVEQRKSLEAIAVEVLAALYKENVKYQ